MSIRISGSKRPLTTTSERHLKGYAESRRRYDARRRQLIEDPTDRWAFKATERLVRADPCSFCGARPADAQMAADHIVPLDGGGANRWDNLTAACRPCNASKRDKSLLTHMLSVR